MMDHEMRVTLACLKRDVQAAVLGLHAAYREFDKARSKEQQAAAKARVREARDELHGWLTCYMALRQADAVGLLG